MRFAGMASGCKQCRQDLFCEDCTMAYAQACAESVLVGERLMNEGRDRESYERGVAAVAEWLRWHHGATLADQVVSAFTDMPSSPGGEGTCPACGGEEPWKPAPPAGKEEE